MLCETFHMQLAHVRSKYRYMTHISVFYKCTICILPMPNHAQHNCIMRDWLMHSLQVKHNMLYLYIYAHRYQFMNHKCTPICA